MTDEERIRVSETPWSPTVYPGITLRDLFAAAALMGYGARPKIMERVMEGDELAQACYAHADAMLRAREGRRE